MTERFPRTMGGAEGREYSTDGISLRPMPRARLTTSLPGTYKPLGSMPDVIVIEDLTRCLGERVNVSHAILAIGQGEIFGLLGPNGYR